MKPIYSEIIDSQRVWSALAYLQPSIQHFSIAEGFTEEVCQLMEVALGEVGFKREIGMVGVDKWYLGNIHVFRDDYLHGTAWKVCVGSYEEKIIVPQSMWNHIRIAYYSESKGVGTK